MRRVYFIYAVRQLTSPLSLKAVTLGACALAATYWVSLSQVFLNMPSMSDFAALFKFFSSAFIETNGAVKLLVIASLGILFMLLRDIVRNFSMRSPMVSRVRI